ncbi:hypothetical protein U3516DRAFT_733124 [Neocallimastix sp. 'constans']
MQYSLIQLFANEISVLIERHKNIEAKLIDAKCDRNNIINLANNYRQKTIQNYDSSHNHPGNEINASKSLIKHKIKDEIKSLIPSDIKSKHIKNKQLFPNVKTFDEVPNESEYYKTIRGEYFMIFKNSNNNFSITIPSKIMENKHIFADGTFLIAPTNSYQVFITRTYVTELLYESTQFLNFLDYFEKTFLNFHNIKYWNYYNIDHITNNASKSYNKFISYYDYQMRIRGIWRKKRKILEKVDEINILVEYYKNMEAELKNIGCSKNDIIENWFNCLVIK